MSLTDPPARDKAILRRQLQVERQTLLDRMERSVQLQHTLRVWLVGREDAVLAAYWPIKGEFDPLPALYRWQEAAEPGSTRRIALPVAEPGLPEPRFHVWWPGCPMEPDAHGIPKPKDTEEVTPGVMFVPCVGYGPGGVRLGYGGGFYDRVLAAVQPRPLTVGLAYAHGFIPWLQAGPGDVPLDVVLTEEGIAWAR